MARRTANPTRGPARSREPLCTFCGKTHEEVAKLLGGPGVYICDACVAICNDILAAKDGQDTSAGWRGWATMSDAELLATLPGALSTAESIREGLQARVDELRGRKVSRAGIGEALGMSGQAAWERFA